MNVRVESYTRQKALQLSQKDTDLGRKSLTDHSSHIFDVDWEISRDAILPHGDSSAFL